MTTGDAITAIVAVLALILATVQTSQTRRQRVRDFEMIYVQRYWELRERLLAETNEDVWQMYFELCEDEIDMRESGEISDTTWRFWRANIVTALADDSWDRLAQRSPDQFEKLRSLASANDARRRSYDPCHMKWPRKWVRGLTELPIRTSPDRRPLWRRSTGRGPDSPDEPASRTAL